MAILNFANREITAKVVYFGATGAGSNTNVRQLHRALAAAGRGSQLHKFGPTDADERSYYFEHEAEDAINGFALRTRIYSLPGGLPLPAHREEVVRDVDALVFVADARPSHEMDNMDALLELEKLLGLQGLELAAVPIVLQVNHTDDEGARRAADVVFDLNPYGFPVLEAVAIEGRGVLDTYQELAAALGARIRDSLAGNDSAITLTAVHRATRITDEEVIQGHIEAIYAKAESTPGSLEVHQAPATADVSPLRTPLTEIAVPFQPRELAGCRPIQILSGDIDGERVRLQLLMQRMSGELRRLEVVLENRPTDTPPVPRHAPPQVTAPETDRVGDYLPATVDLTPVDDSDGDLPPVLYGMLGLAGGVVIGLLGGYLIGAIF